MDYGCAQSPGNKLSVRWTVYRVTIDHAFRTGSNRIRITRRIRTPQSADRARGMSLLTIGSALSGCYRSCWCGMARVLRWRRGRGGGVVDSGRRRAATCGAGGLPSAIGGQYRTHTHRFVWARLCRACARMRVSVKPFGDPWMHTLDHETVNLNTVATGRRNSPSPGSIIRLLRLPVISARAKRGQSWDVISHNCHARSQPIQFSGGVVVDHLGPFLRRLSAMRPRAPQRGVGGACTNDGRSGFLVGRKTWND